MGARDSKTDAILFGVRGENEHRSGEQAADEPDQITPRRALNHAPAPMPIAPEHRAHGTVSEAIASRPTNPRRQSRCIAEPVRAH